MNRLGPAASGIPDHSKCGANCSLKWPSAEYFKHHPQPYFPPQLLQINTPPIPPVTSPVTTPIVTNTTTENKK